MESAANNINQKYTPLLDSIQNELKNMNNEFDSILENLDQEVKLDFVYQRNNDDNYGSTP
ncbi:hypothetical protein IRZ71_21675 [Flavobacterium sp. ANB]|uniref:hypothetical protein n=1 Tax=unclassified Flavobacterium TaxID=196869 RepID=UPI0012B72A4D|nr:MULTISPECIES: hypothetical protein [unclassified Flavobacterium]MBF4518975.1 hypothetical protein [Flavobacterium sp. ANB]MTD71584.1 hypothetical protein [Flavobacterium sp. LC2016-13]